MCQGDTGSVITSGGGFATQILPAPSYETASIASYLSYDIPPPGFGKRKGIPDVALLGSTYTVASAATPLPGGDGKFTTEYGTSASTPVVAAMITLINDARLNNGQSTLGWIHPSLYQNAALFTNDITSGNNFCTAASGATKSTCCPQGFSATKGWDPTTGLGSINFQAFYAFYTSKQCNFLDPPL